VVLVRGYTREDCPFHADVLDQAVTTLVTAGYRDIQCRGGGLIQHTKAADQASGQVLISGTSAGFGRADHTATQAIVAQNFGSAYNVQVVAHLEFAKLSTLRKPSVALQPVGEETIEAPAATIAEFVISKPKKDAFGGCRQQ
jgi:hypothetical protein